MELIIFAGKMTMSAILGSLIGYQRQKSGKAAGVRTYALVTLGATLFTVVSIMNIDGDPSRIAAQIVTGVGFLGAGTIIHRGDGVEGLTTAAGLWASAAIGMAIGMGMYGEAIITNVVILIILFIHRWK
jgi:putative Mg2+ transporter-C (MgtC) family protein